MELVKGQEDIIETYTDEELEKLLVKPHNKMCTILHIASKEAAKASMFFCEKMNDCTPEAELQFASDPLGNGIRVILSGSPKDVMALVNGYYYK